MRPTDLRQGKHGTVLGLVVLDVTGKDNSPSGWSASRSANWISRPQPWQLTVTNISRMNNFLRCVEEVFVEVAILCICFRDRP
jgi:hypothetical protein